MWCETVKCFMSFSSIMNLKLFLFLCLTGLIPVAVPVLTTVPQKYVLIMTPMSWPEAQKYCREKYTDLATILSETDWLRLNKEAESKGLTSSAWVGLYDDIDSWRWSLNELPMKNVTFTYWYPGEPNNGKEACGFIGTEGYWYDTACINQKPFICYDVNVDVAEKFVSMAKLHLSWSEAQTYCRTHHTDLASDLNKSDHSVLAKIYYSQGDSWLGLYRDTWKWSDGTNTSDLTWASKQPDNAKGNENCAVVNSGLFSDEQCKSLNYFFCHTPFSKNQIMRMEVKSNGGVLDPAVQSAMLEKIKKKLEEKGVVNVTVTWRAQPDGNIFHKKEEKKDEL